MLCPSCGFENPDRAGMCSRCGYKFRLGYAFNDPFMMRFFNFSKWTGGKSKVIKLFFLALAVFIILAFIFSIIKAM
ncbi:hypothetical protein JW906_05470 [bacterium]|nr:hypothetical protein [bacterium]